MIKSLKRFAMNAVYPTHGDMPGVLDTNVDAFIDQFSREAHPIMKLGFNLAVVVYVISPFFTIGVPLPAFMLSEEKQLEHSKSYGESRGFVFSQTWLLIKMIGGLCWGMDDKVRAYFGYDPLEGDPGTFRDSF